MKRYGTHTAYLTIAKGYIMNAKRNHRLAVFTAVVTALLFFYPLAKTLLFSLLMPDAARGMRITLRHYADLFFDVFWFYPMFWNSIFYGLATTLPALLFIIPAGFSLAKGRRRHNGFLTTLYLVLMLMPIQAVILPNYIGLRTLGLLDTRLGILLPALFSPFGVYLMYKYMEEIPDDTVSAARLETSSLTRILLHVVIPQTRTAIAAVFLFLFAEGYNLVEQPKIFLKRESLKPLSVLTDTLTISDQGLLFAAGILSLIPPALLFGFFESDLEAGIGRMKF